MCESARNHSKFHLVSNPPCSLTMMILRKLKLLGYPERLLIILVIACLGYLLLSSPRNRRLAARVTPSRSSSLRPAQSPLPSTTLNVDMTLAKHDEFIIRTSGCQIDNADAFDKSVLPFFEKVRPFRCDKGNDVTLGLVYLEKMVLRINGTVKQNILNFYKTRAKDLYCCVDYFKRYSDEQNDNVSRMRNNCTRFMEQIAIEDEFMSITCFLPNTTHPNHKAIYHNFDFAVLRKSHVEARCRAYAELHRGECKDRLSVIIMGIDSVSRLQTIRHLKRTRQMLEDMGAIEFVAYSRVADNTYPNLGAALLAGKRESDLDSECIDNNNFMDKCTFLGDYFGAVGYRTAYMENMNTLGTFTYRKNGFHRMPVDYYGRTFFNGIKSFDVKPNCYRGGASVADDQAVFQFAEEFQTEFMLDPHFGVFWIGEYSHNNLNNLANVDRFLPKQLGRLAQGGILNNTVLVFMADHGLRFGEPLQSGTVRYEINLPTLFLVLPPWFRRKYQLAMQTLKQNARWRLTSHYDLHATLKSFASCVGGAYWQNGGPKRLHTTLPHLGINLFDPIPENRTCEDANIPSIYCACSKFPVAVSSSDSRARMLGQLSVDRLNSLITHHSDECARLGLTGITKIKARTRVTPEIDNQFSVVITTSPGSGEFELLVNYGASKRSYVVEQEVIRLNKYGNSSECIRKRADYSMLPICFCITKS